MTNCTLILKENIAQRNTSAGSVEKRRCLYKNVAGYLSEIATYRKNKARGNAADVAKFTADEKKWNDLYDEISKMKPGSK